MKIGRYRWLLNWPLKGLFLALFFYLLYYDLHYQNRLQQIWPLFIGQFQHAQHQWLFACLLLVPVNWALETEKWYPLVRQFQKISRFRAFEAVLAGVSVALVTPNRMGDYGGRALFIQPNQRWKAVLANLVCNLAQMVVIVGMGIIGTLYYLQRFYPPQEPILWALALAGVAGIALLVLFYFNIELLIPLARKVPGIRYIKRFVKDLAVLRHFSGQELRVVLLLSLLRYLIYSLQYCLLLYFYGIEIGLFEALAGVFTLFLLQTSLPLPPLSGLVVRGNLAIHIWALYGANPLSSLATTFSLWIINLIFPAFLGLIALLRLNLAHSLTYENE